MAAGATRTTNRLEGEAFTGTNDLDMNRLQRLIIGGRSEIRAKLTAEGEIAEHGFSPVVTTTMRIDVNGEVSESYLDVIQEQPCRKQKIPATRIFSNCASKEARILLDKLDLNLFNFSPSSNHSDWINASSFGLTFQRRNNREHGEFPATEWAAQGVGDFALKLVIEASANVGMGFVRVLALPLPIDRLGELPGGCAKDVVAYPAIDVFAKMYEVQLLPQNTEPSRGDSMPVLPLFLYQGPPGTDPTELDSGKIYRAMYAIWGRMAGARGCTSQRFQTLISATPMDVSEVPPEWAWPLLQQQDDNSRNLGRMNNRMRSKL